MKKDQKPNDISIEQYRARLNAMSDTALSVINKSIATMMPEKHITAGTLYSVIIHVAAKAIYLACEEDEKARKASLDFFLERLPTTIKKTIAVPASFMSKNEP